MPTKIVCSKDSLGALFEMRVLIIISLSGLVPSKSKLVSTLRNVRVKSVLDAAAVGSNDGSADGKEDGFVVAKEGV